MGSPHKRRIAPTQVRRRLLKPTTVLRLARRRHFGSAMMKHVVYPLLLAACASMAALNASAEDARYVMGFCKRLNRSHHMDPFGPLWIPLDPL